MKKRRILNTKWLFTLLVSGLLLLFINYQIISNVTRSTIYSDITEIPEVEYGLLLGNPKYLPKMVI